MSLEMKIKLNIRKVITIFIPEDFEIILDKYHYDYEAKISEMLIKHANEIKNAEDKINKIVNPANKFDSD